MSIVAQSLESAFGRAVVLVIILAISCSYFPPGPRLPYQLHSIAVMLQFSVLYYLAIVK